MDSDEADEENKSEDGKTLLYVFERGSERCPCLSAAPPSSQRNTSVYCEAAPPSFQTVMFDHLYRAKSLSQQSVPITQNPMIKSAFMENS